MNKRGVNSSNHTVINRLTLRRLCVVRRVIVSCTTQKIALCVFYVIERFLSVKFLRGCVYTKLKAITLDKGRVSLLSSFFLNCWIHRSLRSNDANPFSQNSCWSTEYGLYSVNISGCSRITEIIV